MKNLGVFALTAACVALYGCSSTGANDHPFRDAFTPGVSAETTVRTWDENGNPHEKKVQNDPAFLYDSERKKASE